ncbi:MAG: sulfotransferase, partial [Chloroflexota bacterium]
ERGVNAAFENFLLSIFRAKIEGTGKKFFSEKTPANLEVFPELQECLSNARFIFVVRDPRAIVASMLEVGRRYRRELRLGALAGAARQTLRGDAARGPAAFVPPAFTRSARRAVEYVNALWARGHAARAQGGNVLMVYYEDLVTEPERAVRAMLEFLGLPFESVNIQEKEIELPDFKSGEQFWYTPEQLRAPIEADRLDKWRQTLTGYERYVIARHLTPLPGLTDRYDLRSGSRLDWALADLWGSWFAQLRAALTRLFAALAKTL